MFLVLLGGCDNVGRGLIAEVGKGGPSLYSSSLQERGPLGLCAT